MLDVYGNHDQSPVVIWLPVLLGLLASAIVALALCPVPQAQTVSPFKAVFLAIAYVMTTVGVGVAVLAACGKFVRGGVSLWRIWALFCSVTAWMTPVVAFYMRNSLWAVPVAFVFAVLGSRLIYRYHEGIGAWDMFPTQLAEFSQVTRFGSLTFAALLLQFGVVALAISMVHWATVLIGCAIVVIFAFRETSNASRSQFAKATGFSIGFGLAIILVGASLTPYLRLPSEEASTAASDATSQTEPTARSSKQKVGALPSASFLRRFLGERGKLAEVTCPTLQSLFGEANESRYSKKKSDNSRFTELVANESIRGVILRPKIEDHMMIAPPLPLQRVYRGTLSDRKVDVVAIPFNGAYWLFRASEKTLPADAVESRGDPASTSFQTTDFTPITMEARQNFGLLIDLSCCRAIELVISNGDRRPGTIAVELILSNTTLPGKPQQSLGVAPVNSTLRWFPGDNRSPATEVLSFILPAQPSIQSFDEVIVRFELQFPRERWSAKIAIEKFRLIPRGV